VIRVGRLQFIKEAGRRLVRRSYAILAMSSSLFSLQLRVQRRVANCEIVDGNIQGVIDIESRELSIRAFAVLASLRGARKDD
jgi:hypothetical protein